MAISEVAGFITGFAGLAIAALAVVVCVGVFMAIARLGNSVRPSPDEKEVV